MENFKPEMSSFAGVIKQQFRLFIESSKSLEDKQKQDLINELGTNWHDKRFFDEKFIIVATEYALHEWKEQNFKLVDLWKSVAIENAKLTTEPYITANETVSEFKKQFNLLDK